MQVLSKNKNIFRVQYDNGEIEEVNADHVSEFLSLPYNFGQEIKPLQVRHGGGITVGTLAATPLCTAGWGVLRSLQRQLHGSMRLVWESGVGQGEGLLHGEPGKK